MDDAVAELVDTAERFDNPDHLVHAVEILVQENRLEEAAPLAERTLPLIAGARDPIRNFIHEVGAAAAHNRGSWKEMEERVRAWINDLGADSHRRWLLVQALLNQVEPDAAWRVLREGSELEPETAFQAQLWTSLYAKYGPGPESLSKMLALCERFPDDADLRAAAVNAFLLMGDDKGEVAPDEVVRWQALVKQRAENPGERDTFVSLHIPDDPDGMIEAFREFLEPQGPAGQGHAGEGAERLAVRDVGGRCRANLHSSAGPSGHGLHRAVHAESSREAGGTWGCY